MGCNYRLGIPVDMVVLNLVTNMSDTLGELSSTHDSLLSRENSHSSRQLYMDTSLHIHSTRRTNNRDMYPLRRYRRRHEYHNRCSTLSHLGLGRCASVVYGSRSFELGPPISILR